MNSIFGNVFKKNTDFSYIDFLKEFNRSISIIIDKDLLIKNVLSKLKDITNSENIYLFILNQDLNIYELYDCSNDSVKLKLNQNALIIKWLLINEKPLFLNEYIFPLDKDEKYIIDILSINVLFPLKVLRKLTGVIFIGGNSKTEKRIKKNIDIISITTDQAAIAFENASLYEQQKDRFKKMYRTEQLAILGQLAAGAAHEIRNPLTIIKSTIQFIKDEVNNKDLVCELVEEVDRINAIVQGLLNFAKPTELDIVFFSLETLISQSILLAKTTTKNKIEYRFIINCTNSDIRADFSQLKQVFLNLILNAIDAVSNKCFGLIIITLNYQMQDNDNRPFFLIELIDNGYGISAENMEKLFIPFFTTKTNGTGLGLSICYGIINRHNGEIEIQSKENEGTTIKIKLPK
jgi:two-component system, NtrC family, sensor kinase